jgi:hypothetical protein
MVLGQEASFPLESYSTQSCRIFVRHTEDPRITATDARKILEPFTYPA